MLTTSKTNVGPQLVPVSLPLLWPGVGCQCGPRQQSAGALEWSSQGASKGCACEGESLWQCAESELRAMFGKHGSSTTIIFDWDDTLFPATALDAGGNLELPFPRVAPSLSLELMECAAAAVLALRSARKHGNTVVVTSAEHGWVQTTAARFLPLLASELRGIPVISAQSIFKPLGISDGRAWKVLCFQRILQCFRAHTARVQGVWSLVSIGDSIDEQEATVMVARRCPCRSKTLKLIERPTISQLIKQLEVSSSQLPNMTSHKGSLDINLGQIIADEGVLAECIIEKQFLTSRLHEEKRNDNNDLESAQKRRRLLSWARKLGA